MLPLLQTVLGNRVSAQKIKDRNQKRERTNDEEKHSERDRWLKAGDDFFIFVGVELCIPNHLLNRSKYWCMIQEEKM